VTPDLPPSVVTRDGVSLMTRHWRANASSSPVGVACLVHGLGEHSGRYEKIARHLNGLGWDVVAYDQRGHGRSGGDHGVLNREDDFLHDLSAVIDTVRDCHANLPLALVGHSLGGLIVARFVAALCDPSGNVSWRRPVDWCVLSSPALAIHISWFQKCLMSTVGRLTPNLALRNGLDPSWMSRDPAVVQAYQSDPLVHHKVSGRLVQFMLDAGETVLANAARWNTPTLLVYSDKDRCVDPRGSAKFASLAPSSVVAPHPFDRVSHELFNDTDSGNVYSVLTEWLSGRSLA
jgi:alpha-beta hydrolase superfamily lysophospholipase